MAPVSLGPTEMVRSLPGRATEPFSLVKTYLKKEKEKERKNITMQRIKLFYFPTSSPMWRFKYMKEILLSHLTLSALINSEPQKNISGRIIIFCGTISCRCKRRLTLTFNYWRTRCVMTHPYAIHQALITVPRTVSYLIGILHGTVFQKLIK